MRTHLSQSMQRLRAHLHLWHQILRQQNILQLAQARCWIAAVGLGACFLVVALRLTHIMVLQPYWGSATSSVAKGGVIAQMQRADILDCRGEVLATNVTTSSLYANPKQILNAQTAARQLAEVIPGLEPAVLQRRFSSGKGFAWIKRHVSPRTVNRVMQLGIPGVYSTRDYRRVYPFGRLTAHAVGHTNIDNRGSAGLGQFFDQPLNRSAQPLRSSLDIRVQYVVYQELLKAVERFEAKGAHCVIIDRFGRILAMVSLPDFDPARPILKDTFNRITMGCYEPGSVMKVINTAIALDSGAARLDTIFDARAPIYIGRHKVDDFQPQRCLLTLARVLKKSSNIGSIQAARLIGPEKQREYFHRFALNEKPTLEMHEVAGPQIPKRWDTVVSATAAYGYGVSLTALQLIRAFGAILCNGQLPQLSMLAEPKSVLHRRTDPVISEGTSAAMRALLYSNVSDMVDGGARQTHVPGYCVMAKTGTAYKAREGAGQKGYDRSARRAAAIGGVGVLPDTPDGTMPEPAFVVAVFLDDPKAVKGTHGFTAAGWNAAPTFSAIARRVALLLGLEPRLQTPYDEGQRVVATQHQTP